MKSKAVAVPVALLLIALVTTNPGKDDFLRWFEARAEAAAQGQDGLSRLSLLERAVEVRTTLRRNNYLLFSIFHIQVARREYAFVGVVGGFAGLGDAGEAVPRSD